MRERPAYPFASIAALALMTAFLGFAPAVGAALPVDDSGIGSPDEPAPGAVHETLVGTVETVVIDDRVINLSLRYAGIRLDDGRAFALKGAMTEALVDGARVEVTGRRNGNVVITSGARQLATAPDTVRAIAKAGSRREFTGQLRLLHADYFSTGRSEYMFDVETDDGQPLPLMLAALPPALESGMRVIVSGVLAEDGISLRPDRIVILALPAVDRASAQSRIGMAKAVTTNNVLVVMMQYANQPTQPFTLAQIQAVFGAGAGSGSVTEYYKEASFGQQLLNPTYTGWLHSSLTTPVDGSNNPICDYNGGMSNSILTLGNNLATAAGFNLASYQNIVYVFPNMGACGWAGLAYIGWGRAFINAYNQTAIYGHELGHNFGLGHAASLACFGNVIGGACSVSEYGDPFSIMGTQNVSHFNAAQKRALQWIPASSVRTQSAGASTYSLAALEAAGGTTYAVTLPTRPNRTFWMEYRQPVGYFDSSLSGYPNNGAQVRVAYPFDWICGGCGDDTELLDMTPGTASFTDATLVAGKNFRDPTTGVSLSALGASGTGLSMLVQMPGQPVISDFNGDGKADLLWRNPGTGDTVMWLMNGGVPTGGGSILQDKNWVVSHVGDFNGDGKTDIVWRNLSTGASALWLMNGTTLLGGGGLMTNPLWVVTHVADFNGDGKADLVWRNLSTGETVIWLMSGTSILGGASIMTDANWVVTYTGDFNGDGKADLVWRNVATGQTAIWLMNGMSFVSGGGIMSDPNWTVTHVADFNGDGKSDLVWRNTSSGATALWLMNGASLTSGGALLLDPNWHVTHVADLNGDGKADIIWRNMATGQTAAWLMNGTAIVSGAGLLSSASWSVVRTGDLDGNGKADIVWRNSSTSETAVWLMNGTAPLAGASLTTDPNNFVQP